MVDSVRLCLLVMFLLIGLTHTGEVIYYSRRAIEMRPEWKGRIWILGILGIVGYVAFMLLIWFPYYVPSLKQWSTLLFAVMVGGMSAALAHRLLLRRMLR